MKINIGGDFCITPDFLSKNLLGKNIIDLFQKSNFNIINLECPITADEQKERILKTGPSLRTDIKIIDHLKKLNINVVTIANNHILDYGKKGLQDTIECCKKNGIQYVGAGMNLKESSKPLIIEKNKIKIGIVNVCENEWSIATSSKAGANPLDTINIYKKIQEFKKKIDKIIVIIHGGHEFYSLPSPRMVKQYRFFAECGADAIIGHHTHCIGGYEIYNGVPIVYSLGNMLFTIDNKNPNWYIGLIAQLYLDESKTIKLNLYPIKQNYQSFELNLLSKKEKVIVLEKIKILNQSIINEDELLKKWDEFAANNSKRINTMSPINNIKNKYIKVVLKRIGINTLVLTKNYLIPVLNIIRCEAHRELLLKLLNNKIKDT